MTCCFCRRVFTDEEKLVAVFVGDRVMHQNCLASGDLAKLTPLDPVPNHWNWRDRLLHDIDFSQLVGPPMVAVFCSRLVIREILEACEFQDVAIRSDKRPDGRVGELRGVIIYQSKLEDINGFPISYLYMPLYSSVANVAGLG